MSYWLSPLSNCNVCSAPFNGVMYDARVGRGAWGNICQKCFDDYGCSLGLGRGQKYELQSDNRWLKTGG